MLAKCLQFIIFRCLLYIYLLYSRKLSCQDI